VRVFVLAATPVLASLLLELMPFCGKVVVQQDQAVTVDERDTLEAVLGRRLRSHPAHRSDSDRRVRCVARENIADERSICTEDRSAVSGG
jgi:hypothetical protein